MEYPFQHVEHKIYKNTFLQSVSVKLLTDTAPTVPEGFDTKSIEFTERFFQLEANVAEIIDAKEFSVTDPDEDVSYSFRFNNAQLNVGRKHYVSFLDNVMNRLVPLKEFMYGVMNNARIDNLVVRKLNLFPFTANSDAEVLGNADQIFPYFFNKELLELVQDKKDSLPSEATWVLIYKKAELSTEKYPFETAIRIGISKTKQVNRYNVTLDTSIRYTNPGEIEEGAIDRLLISMNDMLFDAFHWSVTDEIIHLMEKEEK